jgi:predicted ATPase
LEEFGHAVVEHAGRRPLAVPDTVQAVLAARIDRLAVEDKRLLQTAAVIGRHVPLALLEAVSGLSEASLAPRLARLLIAEFLVESGSRLRACDFKHALTQAAAYAGLAVEARRALHLKVVEALEAQTSDVRPEQVEELAYHAAEGGAWEKAVEYPCRAASVAAARGARQEVVVCYQRALAILETLPWRSSGRWVSAGGSREPSGCSPRRAGAEPRSRDARAGSPETRKAAQMRTPLRTRAAAPA